MTARALRSLLVVMVFCSAPAWAISLRGDAADRASAEPLRQANLAQAIDGRERLTPALSEAFAKLPDKCTDRTQDAIVDPCDDSVRCRWLAARHDAVAAWGGGDIRARQAAAERLHRLADALRAGLTCDGGERARTRHAEDMRLAELDDARAQLALLLEERIAVVGLVARADETPLVAMLTNARRGGIASIGDDELRARRVTMALVRGRAAWLAEQPNVGALREMLATLWEPAGGIPSGCGRDLFDPERMNDQWRGWLVREEIPRALECVGARLVPALKRAKITPVDPSFAARARELADLARRDSGGRRFLSDEAVLRDVKAMAQGLAPRTAQAVASSVPAPAQKAPASRASNASVASAPRSKAASDAPARARREAPAAEPERSVATAADGGPALPDSASLIALARRVAARAGGDERIVENARGARTAAQRSRELEAMLVTLHRAVCAPLERLDPNDLAAARLALLADAQDSREESACRSVQGQAGIEAMLAAAPTLERLRWAAVMRSAARDTALGRAGRAADALDAVPDGYRGTTWVLVRAWSARLAGDPVTASRVLAMLETDLYEKLRASEEESIARLAAHAGATASPK